MSAYDFFRYLSTDARFDVLDEMVLGHWDPRDHDLDPEFLPRGFSTALFNLLCQWEESR